MSEYRFKSGTSFGVPAQAAGERLEKIRKKHKGHLSPRDVVDDARPVNAVLHPVFEWDDHKAAENFRRDQASGLIRNLRVVADDPEQSKPQLCYVSIRPEPSASPCYTTVAAAMADDDLRQQVLAAALTALKALRARYGHLTELADIFAAVDALKVAV